MFDIGWSEMLVIAVVMIVVVGPKDLPKMLRTVGKMTAKMRTMAGDFQRQFNEALKEAELDEVKKSVDSLRSMNPVSEVKKQLNPFEKAAADVRAGLQSLNPTVAAPSAEAAQPEQAAVPVTHEAEPLKNGATAMPGVAGPDVMPTPPVLATPAPSPEPAKPGAPAVAMSDPMPTKVNGAAAPIAAAVTPAAPAKAAAKARATKAAATKSAAKPAAPKSASKAVADKPKSPAKAPAKSKAVASDKKSGKTT